MGMAHIITAGMVAGGASVIALLAWATRAESPEPANCVGCGQRQAHKAGCPRR